MERYNVITINRGRLLEMIGSIIGLFGCSGSLIGIAYYLTFVCLLFIIAVESGHFDQLPNRFFIKFSIYIAFWTLTAVGSFMLFLGIKKRSSKKINIFRWCLVVTLVLLLLKLINNVASIPDEMKEQMIFQEIYIEYKLYQIKILILILFCFICLSYLTYFLEKMFRHQPLPEIQPQVDSYQAHPEPQATIVEIELLCAPLNQEFPSDPVPNSTAV